jgi:tetratricopeptide (TPR) repeat protein
LALQEGDGAAAKGLMDNALKLTPQHPGALKILAEALKRLGKYEDAIGILEQAQKIAADPLPFLISRAQFILESRGQELGRQALQNLAERYPDRAEVFVALSQMLAIAGDLHEAIQAAQQAAKQDKGLSREERASLQLHLGQLLKHSGQLDQSLHHLDKAVEQAPNLAEAHMERGRVFLARRQHHAALQAFEMAAKAAPEQAAPHLEAALALKEAKDYPTAESELRAAAKLAPKDARVQKQLAAVIALNLVHKPEGTGVAV